MEEVCALERYVQTYRRADVQTCRRNKERHARSTETITRSGQHAEFAVIDTLLASFLIVGGRAGNVGSACARGVDEANGVVLVEPRWRSADESSGGRSWKDGVSDAGVSSGKCSVSCVETFLLN